MSQGKGRSGSEELVTKEAAAQMLQVCLSVLDRFCKQGILSPVYLAKKRGRHFKVHEVAALAEVRAAKLNFASVAAMATRAFVIAKANEKRLEELLHLVGLKRKFLGTTVEEVGSLYEQASHLSARDGFPTIPELEEWALTLHSIDEAYLLLVQTHTASREPWKVFLDLASKWANERHLSGDNELPDLRRAYDMLEASRRNLRAVAYMLCRRQEGAALTNQLFGTGKILDQVLDALPALTPDRRGHCKSSAKGRA